MPPASIAQLTARLRAHDARALARAISHVEDRSPLARPLLKRMAPRVGAAHRIGITGPPGVGKSTLIAHLAPHLKRPGHRLAILAIDPTSPLTGGAFLGDRVRMQSLVMDPRVFIRSLATRGTTHGLAPSTQSVADLCDAAGADPILIETVGAGQADWAVTRLVQTTVVVLTPGLGDTMQLLKAGLLELAHILVVNKADHRGAPALVQELQRVFRRRDAETWPVRILSTVAEQDRGLPALAQAIRAHRSWLAKGLK